MHKPWFALAAVGLTAITYGQGAMTLPDAKLVNMDTGAIPALNVVRLSNYGRFFGGNESLVYTGLQIDTGLAASWGLTVRGSFAKFKSFAAPTATIRHGGSDFETLVRYSVPTMQGVTVSLGSSVPNTPAQNKPFATAGVVFKAPSTKANLYVGASGVFRKDSTLIGLSGGAQAWLSPELSFVADVTLVTTGNNTFSTTTAQRQRRHVFGAGLRFSPNSPTLNATIDVGVTNAIGGTSGFALTPALGKSMALYIAGTVRF